MSLVTEVKCPAYKEFPTGVEGGASDPCKPAGNLQLSLTTTPPLLNTPPSKNPITTTTAAAATSVQLSSTTDPSCTLKCKAGYEQKVGSGASTLQCAKDGNLSGALTCTGVLPYIARTT